MSKKRFLSIFAVLFVIIFSVACVFTACGKSESGDSGDKGSDTTTEEPAEPGTPDAGDGEHVHTISHVDAKSADCKTGTDGNIEYWYCSGCGKYFSDAEATKEITKDETVVAWAHTLEHTEAKSAVNCTTDGNIEYWKCSTCGKFFSDAAGATEIKEEDTIAPGTHSLEHTEAKAADCSSGTDGNIEYWKCSVCQRYFADSAATQEITQAETVVAWKHSLTYTAAVAATCTTDGNIEYWYCSDCQKYFSDANATAAITGDVKIDKLGHTYPDPDGECKDTHIEWGWASRSDTTVQLTLKCTVCGEVCHTEQVTFSQTGTTLSASATVGTYTYSDTYDTTQDGDTHTHNYVIDTTSWSWSTDYSSCTVTANCTSTVGDCPEGETSITLTATVTSEETRAATCTETGEMTYTASVSGYTETDTKTAESAALGHTLEHTEAKAADCSTGEDGNTEYWYCSVCQKYFSDCAATTEMAQTDTVVAWAHSLTHSDAVAATCETAGSVEYWYCSGCQKYFSDAEATTEISQENIGTAATGHDWEIDASSWSWDFTNGTPTVTVSFNCKNDGSHSKTETATVTYEDGTYTAVVTGEGETTYTDTRTPQNIYTVTVTSSGAERITENEEIDLTATITDASGNAVTAEYGQIKWSADDTTVVTLDADTGHVTGAAPGTAVITATYNDKNGNYGVGIIYIIVAKGQEQAEGKDCTIKVDFSSATGVGTDTSVAFDEGGVATYIDWETKGKVTEDGALSTGSFTSFDGTHYTSYLLIDFSGYMNYNFEITVTFTSEEETATVAAVDALIENAGGSGDSSSVFGEEPPNFGSDEDFPYKATYSAGGEPAVFTYSGNIYDPNRTETGDKDIVNEVVYIVWDSAISITGMTIELWTGDKSVQLDETWEGLDIDFSNPPQELKDYYTSLNGGDFTGETTQGVKVADGVLTLMDVMAETNWVSGQKYIDTGASGQYGSGYTTTAKDNEEYGYSYDGALTNYFIINLHGLAGSTVVVTIVYTTPEGTSGTLYLTTAVEDLADGATPTTGYILASGAAGTDQKLSAAVTVPADGLMYIEYSGPMYIKSLKISFGTETDVDTTPVYDLEIDTETTSINLTIETTAEGTTYGEAQLGYRVTEGGQLLDTLPEGATISWSSSNESVATVDGTGKVTAVGEGFALITVKFTYEAYGISLESGAVTINVVPVLNDGGIHINFSDSSWAGAISTGVINLTDAGEDGTATLQYKASNASGIATDDNGVTALKTGNSGDNGSTHFSGSSTSANPLSDATNYFIINIPDGATYMEITVKFSSVYSTEDVQVTDYYSGFLALTSEIPSTLWSANGTAYNEKKNRVTGSLVSSDAIMESTVKSEQLTFTWKGYVSEWETLYILLGSSQYIYSLDVYFTSPGHTHEYNGDVTWTWTETNEGGWTATATTSCSAAECNHDESATIVVTATVTSQTTDPTCEEVGKTVYTATATISGSREVSDTKEIEIEALGHDFVISYVESVEGTDDGWYYTCTRGDVVGEAITDGTGLTFNVTSLAELQAALNLSGAVVVLGSDIVGCVTVSESVTLDLAGHKLVNTDASDTGSTSHTIEVLSGGKLTIEDTGDGQGIVDNISDGCAAIFVDESGEAVLEGGTFTRSAENTTGGTYYTIVNHGTMTINSGVTVKTEATTTSSMIENGWATASENETEAMATLTINGGTFEGGANNLIKNDDYGKLTVKGGTFTDDGVSVILNYGELEISNGTFTQESTENNSLVVWNKDGGVAAPTAKISAGTFTGGATATLYNDATGKVEISGGTFENSLYAVIYSEGEIKISGGTFKSTGTNLEIYIVWAADGAVDISKGTFTAGDASDYLVVAGGAAEVTISGGTFSGPSGATMLYTYKASDAGEIEATITVTGGSFSADPGEYVKPGFAASQSGGTYTVVEEVYTITITAARNKVAVESQVTLSVIVEGNVSGVIENPQILWTADDSTLVTLAQDEGTFTADGIGTVVITATYEYAAGLYAMGTITITIVAKGEENQIVHLDFADPDTYSWLGVTAPETPSDSTGDYVAVSAGDKESPTEPIKLVVDSGELPQLNYMKNTGYVYEEDYVALRIGTTSASTVGSYFEIDVSSLRGETVTITMVGGYSGSNGDLILSTDKTASTTSGVLASGTMPANDRTPQVITWVGEIDESWSKLYVKAVTHRVWVLSIDVTLGEVAVGGEDEEEELTEVTLVNLDMSDYSTYSWMGMDEANTSGNSVNIQIAMGEGNTLSDGGRVTLYGTGSGRNGFRLMSVGDYLALDTGNDGYIMLDVSDLVGTTVTVKVIGRGYTSAVDKFIATDADGANRLATANFPANDNLVTLEWTGVIAEGCTTLYIGGGRSYLTQITMTAFVSAGGEDGGEGGDVEGHEEENGWEEVHIDFSQSETYSWIQTDPTLAAGTYTNGNGEISFTRGSGTGTAPSVSSNGYLDTKTASNATGSPTYFTIDLSTLKVGETITFTIEWCSNGSSSRTLMISSGNTSTTTLQNCSDTSSNTTKKTTTFTYTKEEGVDSVCLAWTGQIYLYSITITQA